MRLITEPDSENLRLSSRSARNAKSRPATAGTSRDTAKSLTRHAERRKPFSDADLALFLSNMSTLLNSGIPLIKALEALATDESVAKSADTLAELIQDIRAGESFSGALKKHPSVFSSMTVSLVRAGEASGRLVPALERLAKGLEERRATIMQIRQALTYPTIVTVLGTGAIGFLMIFVVPVFEVTYAKAKMPLPAITRALLGVSGVVVATWWIVILLGIGVGWAYWRYRAHPTVRVPRDRLLLRLPVVGPVVQGAMVCRFVRTLGSLLVGGISVKESLQLTKSAMNHVEYVGMVQELWLAVTRGEGIGSKLSEYRTLMPPLLTRMIVLGETSGDLGVMILRVGEFAEKDFKRRIQKMMTLIEPLLTMIMAAAIGTIAMAIYLPIFDMFQQIK